MSFSLAFTSKLNL